MSWVFSSLPQWIWLVVLLIGIIAVQVTLGWKSAAGAAIGAALWVMNGRAYKKGRDDSKQENEEDADRAINQGIQARNDANRRNADPEQLRENDKYRRD